MTIVDAIQMFEACHPDYIIHTAAYGNHHDQKDFSQMIEINIKYTYKILS